MRLRYIVSFFFLVFFGGLVGVRLASGFDLGPDASIFSTTVVYLFFFLRCRLAVRALIFPYPLVPALSRYFDIQHLSQDFSQMPVTSPDLEEYFSPVAVSFPRHLMVLSSAAAARRSGNDTPRIQLTSVPQHQYMCYP